MIARRGEAKVVDMVTQMVSPIRSSSTRWIASATLWLAAAYGLLRLWWTLSGTRPDMAPTGDDLHVFSDWGIVGLCVAAVACAVAFRSERAVRFPRTVVALAGVVVAALAVSVVLVMLDVVGLLLLGTSGIALEAVAVASRVTVVLIAVGLCVAAWGAYRRWIADCGVCGRREGSPRAWSAVPGWAFVAAYAAIAGYLARIVVQFPFDGPTEDISSSDLLTLAVVASSAGVVLPLALVHGFGRVWPRWVPTVAGCLIPRGLVLIPAVLVTMGMNIYFGLNFVGLVFMGTEAFSSDFPDWFWWSSIGAYMVWGLGLAAATYAYARVTKRRCGVCQRR